MDPIPWLASVPHKFLRDEFQGAQPFLPPLKTDMQSGAVRQRRMFTLAVATMKASIYMTDDQFVAFRNWVRDDLDHGTRKITIPVMTGKIEESKTAQFVEPYTWMRMGMGWKVSFNLRVEGF